MASMSISYCNYPGCIFLFPDDLSKFQKDLVEEKEPGVKAMLAIAAAAQERSLAAYTQAVEKYAEHLTEDHIIAYHLRDLREDMMEKNLTRYTVTVSTYCVSTTYLHRSYIQDY
jgi:hypothetical protein